LSALKGALIKIEKLEQREKALTAQVKYQQEQIDKLATTVA
jgi:hypothetical protein